MVAVWLRAVSWVGLGLFAACTVVQAADGKILYETRFEEGQGSAPAGWTAEGGGATWDTIGRGGKALKISTEIGDKKVTKWIGTALPCSGEQALRITGWWANNLRWCQDYLYCGVVCASFYDAAGKEVSRSLVTNLCMPPKPMRYVYEWYVPEGLFWTFFGETVAVPAGAVTFRTVFTFSNYTESWRDVLLKGDIWLDDLRITSAQKISLTPTAATSTATNPVILGVHTPVEQNLFLPSDKLEFDIAIPSQASLPTNAWNTLRFTYDVYDIERLHLLHGEIPIATAPQPYDKDLKLGPGNAGYWLRVYLSDDLKRLEGQWLAVGFTLRDSKTSYASGDTAFAVMKPRLVPLDQITQQRIMQGTIAGRYRQVNPSDFIFGYPRTPPWGDTNRPSWLEVVGFGGLPNLYCIGGEWAKAQPTADSPIDFSKFPDNPGKPISGRPEACGKRVIPWEERIPSYRFFIYLQVPSNLPDWMIPKDKDGKPKLEKVNGMFVYPQLDARAFAKWALEAVKHTDSTHYVITSMEGPGYPEYTELVRETAKTIKAWDKRLKLGVCGPAGREGATKLEELGLIENLDFLCNDIYSTVVEDKDFVDEVHKYKPEFEYILTEYMDVVGKGHVGLARNTIQFITCALGSGISKVNWYASPALRNALKEGRHTWGPDLWLPYESKGDVEFSACARTTGEGPRIVPDNPTPLSIIPLLNQIALYHLNRLVSSAIGGEAVPGLHSQCRTFGFLLNSNSLYITWTRPGVQPFDALLETDAISLEQTDMCGRRTTVQPLEGKAFLSFSENPVFLAFSSRISKTKAGESPISFEGLDGRFIGGGEKEITVRIKSPFSSPTSVKIVPGIDDRWRITPAEQEVSLKPNEPVAVRFKLAAPADLPSQSYPLFVNLYAGQKQIGRLVHHLIVAESVNLDITARPLTRQGRAALKVNIMNDQSVAISGKVMLENPITSQWEPIRLEQAYAVPSNSSREVIFELDGKPSVAKRHEFTAELIGRDGSRVKKTEYAFFIGSSKAVKPLTVDGDLSDWNLTELIPNPFYFLLSYGEKNERLWKDRSDCDGVMYTRWDDQYLYFAFDIRKNEFFNDGELSDVWPYDCIHVSLYPWGMKKGDFVKAVQYRDHVAIDKHGKAIIDRCQGPYPIPSNGYWPEGAKLAIKRTDKGYIFELAYSREAIKPLELKAGARFRLALAFLYSKADKPGFIGIGWFYGIGNVDGAPDLHGEIELVD